jgi:hypothetical protein
MNGEGASTVRRTFPVAPGETIRRGDVVTVFDDRAYACAELPFDALPRFSPDVLYFASPGERTRVLHEIGGGDFLHIGSADRLIRLTRIGIGPDGIVEKAVKTIPVYGAEGLNTLTYRRLTDAAGLLCYLAHNSPNRWRIVVVRWPDAGGLTLGAAAETEMHTYEPPIVESVAENRFVAAWRCTRAEPYRVKTRVGTIGDDLAVRMEGNDGFVVEAAPLLSEKIAFVKLVDRTFALTYWIDDAAQPTLVTRLVSVPDVMIELGPKTELRPGAPAKNVELRSIAMTASSYVILQKVESELRVYGVIAGNDFLTIGAAPARYTFPDSYFDAVRISERRIALAYNDRPTGAIVTAMLGTHPVPVPLFERRQFGSILAPSNELTFTPLGDSLFALTFNSALSYDTHDYTQALLLRLTPDMTGFDEVNVREQLTNVWDQGSAAESFRFCAAGAGRLLAAGGGRVKLFRCGWSPTRFIDAGVGEFAPKSGAPHATGRLYETLRLSNGFVALAYRERDTWHGKLSVFAPVAGGGYRPHASHTFSYSHVDNLALAEVAPGKLAVQYKQQRTPSYNGDPPEGPEQRVLVATVTDEGLTDKTTLPFDSEQEDPYRDTRWFALPDGPGLVLVLGQDAGINLFARVYRFQDAGSASSFTPVGPSVRIDYERISFAAGRLAPNAFYVSSAGTNVVEVEADGTIHVGHKLYWNLGPREVHGIFGEDGGEATALAVGEAGAMESIPLIRRGQGLFQADDATSRGRGMRRPESELLRWRGKLAFLYRAAWSGGGSQPGVPAQDLRLALLERDPPADDSAPSDRHYRFPSSPEAGCAFLPLDDGRAFCVLSDGLNNQRYAIAYVDDAKLSFGRPYLTPSGIAGGDGAEGQHVEVTLRGLAEAGATLKAGAVYYAGKDGRPTVEPTGRKLGLAVSARELLLEP